ncbi:MAG: hypothetical protein IPM45_16175 [Acidimicrobiales bacterium]|nr:hypothetical protein [Acidimicrobiales bacterium]
MLQTELRYLQTRRCAPSVSILLPTTRRQPLGPAGRARLNGLMASAHTRLQAETDDDVARLIVSELHRLAAELGDEPLGEGLALFASPELARTVVLDVPVRERVVVDDTFATRDLVVDLSRRVRYALVTVSERQVRVFEGDRDRLTPMDVGDATAPDPDRRATGSGPEQRWRRSAATVRDALSDDPLPVVLAGVDRATAAFRAALGDAALVIGTLRGNHDRTPWTKLVQSAWPLVEAHMAELQAAALRELEAARGSGLVASGLVEAWRHALAGRGALVLVERGFAPPARHDHAGDLELSDDPEEPGAIDDAADELVEAVLTRGGRVAFVDDGALAGDGRVALALRYRP